jgi:DNA-binding NtrC family response regulator
VRFSEERESTTSKRHAEIEREGDTYVLCDLASTHGSFVNGKRVARHSLKLGDVVRLGDWLGVLVNAANYTGWSESICRLAEDLYGGPVLDAALAPARKAATALGPFLVRGETGTGKERVARAIYKWSRRTGQYCAFHGGSSAPHLIESDLFGHDRRGFTDVAASRPGYFAAANNGTLLLDDVETLPLAFQPKLLRILEESEAVPVGSPSMAPVKFEVQVIAATQKSLADEALDGRFRSDLYHRLNGVSIELPPLRERRADIPELFRMFFERARSSGSQITPEFMERLCCYSWPGNVRELEKLASALGMTHEPGESLGVGHLHRRLEPTATPAPSGDGEATDEPEPPDEQRESRLPPGHAIFEVKRRLEEIHGDMARGVSARAMEEKYGLPKPSLYRALAHVLGPEAWEKLKEQREAGRSGRSMS